MGDDGDAEEEDSEMHGYDSGEEEDEDSFDSDYDLSQDR